METFNCCVHSINKGYGDNRYLHTPVYNIEHGYNGSKDITTKRTSKSAISKNQNVEFFEI